MDTLLDVQPSILAPEDDAALMRTTAITKAIAAALTAERARVIVAGILAARVGGYDRPGVMKRSLERLYPDMSDGEYYARRDGTPWPPPEGVAPVQVTEPVSTGCGCEDCRRDRGELPRAPEPAPERACACESCSDTTCEGSNGDEHERCDSYFCEECHGECYRNSCCGYDSDCDTHLEYDDASTCDEGHCHSCGHECDGY